MIELEKTLQHQVLSYVSVSKRVLIRLNFQAKILLLIKSYTSILKQEQNLLKRLQDMLNYQLLLV